MGQPLGSGQEIRRGLADQPADGYQDSLAHALVFRCMVAYEQGTFRAAAQLGRDGVVISRAVHDGFTALRTLAFLCQACWSAGQYAQALSMLHEGRAKAQERQNTFMVGRLTNTLGWFSREFGAVSRAIELEHESMELGRASRIANVEISALINLGLDYLALDQFETARGRRSSVTAGVQAGGTVAQPVADLPDGLRSRAVVRHDRERAAGHGPLWQGESRDRAHAGHG